ncbi:hypothetical protein QBC43DRAFT_319118 [Cladorrhinum sp. PSN259]|nr:hypothetical protein QBC43DRAFT_319118 [Cladorrhinum sp. PSN259]
MEPLSALSVAAAVIQFVDFGSRMLSEARGIYVGKISSLDQELLSICNNFAELSDEVESKSRVLQTRPAGSSQDTFLRLCQECKHTSSELQGVISNLRAKKQHAAGRAGDTLVALMATIWSDSQIKKTKQKLEEIRGHMMMAALVHIWSEAGRRGAEAATFAAQQAEIISKLDRRDEITRDFCKEVAEVMRNESYEGRKGKAKMMDGFWSSKLLPPPRLQEAVPDSPDQHKRNRMVEAAIANSLLFGDIGNREEAVPEAHKETFRWFFHRPRDGDDGIPLWSDFTTWLEGPSKDIYWITGKPGAGKSTLMKYILGNAALQPYLSSWSGGLPFILAGFYFWNAGTALQKSQEGLLRTLLYQIFSARSGLVSDTCPRRWALLQVFGSGEGLPDWTLPELVDCFSGLKSRCGKEFNIMVMIDGLDEFEGAHQNLIALVQNLSTQDGIKICASSRPWNVFQDTYSQGPMLRLEKLTRMDIDALIRSEFGKSRAFRELKECFPTQADELLQNIGNKAQGVFLWVSIVVRTLLLNMSEGDRLKELQASLDSLPADLSDLFQRIWDRIEPKYHAEASQYFQMIESMLRRGQNTFLQTLWLADEDIPCGFKISRDEGSANASALKIIKRRLNSRTRGLVDTYDSGRVDYLHRTTRDWIIKNWDSVISKSPLTYDCNLALFKAITIQISAIAAGAPRSAISFDAADFWTAASVPLSLASSVSSEIHFPALHWLLDALDAAFVKLSAQEGSGSGYQFWEHLSRRHHRIGNWTLARFGEFSNTIDVHKPVPNQVRFLALCAQIPISSYLGAKLHAQQQQSPASQDYTSVLESALFGSRFHNGTQLPISGMDSPPSYGEERLNLIRYILGRCAFRRTFLSSLCEEIAVWERSEIETDDIGEYLSGATSVLRDRMDQMPDDPGEDIRIVVANETPPLRVASTGRARKRDRLLKLFLTA